jgi:hypothetical protein
LRHTLGRECEVLCLKWRIRLETDDVAAVAKVQERASAGADGAALQTVLVKIDGAEVFAVTTVLPLRFGRRRSLAFKIDLAEEVTAILTLDRTLSRGEESSFVFGTEYSHFGSSLQGRVTVQVVLGAKHEIVLGETYGLKMTFNGKRFAGSCIDYGHTENFAILFITPLDARFLRQSLDSITGFTQFTGFRAYARDMPRGGR